LAASQVGLSSVNKQVVSWLSPALAVYDEYPVECLKIPHPASEMNYIDVVNLKKKQHFNVLTSVHFSMDVLNNFHVHFIVIVILSD
jgi:hypothetical protein